MGETESIYAFNPREMTMFGIWWSCDSDGWYWVVYKFDNGEWSEIDGGLWCSDEETGDDTYETARAAYEDTWNLVGDIEVGEELFEEVSDIAFDNMRKRHSKMRSGSNV